MPPASEACRLTCRPPRGWPAASASAPCGARTSTDRFGANCASVACCTVSGTAGTAAAEAVHAQVRHGDDAKARERIVERYRQRGPPFAVELHARIPQQQGIEQFARWALAAATAGRHRLAPIVAPADDFHLRG